MKLQVVKQNVGADMSKNDFKVCLQQLYSNQVRKIKKTSSFKNTPEGFKAFVMWLRKNIDPNAPLRITLEATGIYYEQFVHYLNDYTDFHISVLLPTMTKAYFKSLNIKSKTDKIDAKTLGQMGIERDLKRWQPLSDQMHQLRQLTRNRVSLVEMKTMVKNRLHATEHSYSPSKEVIKQLKAQIRLLDRQIKKTEIEIEAIVDNDEMLEERIEKICKIKGLGLMTVATVVAETGGFVLFNSRSQLVSYAGYDVVQNQSGTSVNSKTKISKKGNRFIRRALYFPSISMSRMEPAFKSLHDRVFHKTRIKKKAFVAVQRKALILIYTLFKNNAEYDPNYQNHKSEAMVS